MFARVLVMVLLAACPAAAAGRVPLVDAAERGDLAAVRALIGQKTDVNAAREDGQSALHAAVYADRLDVADALLRAGAAVAAKDRYGLTPLYFASLNGSAPIIQRLIEAGADPNSADPGGETALMTATAPVRVAVMSAVSPPGSAALASAPASSSRWMSGALPFRLAR